MKGQATFEADVWNETWFRPLPLPTKLLWFFIHSECDRAGWWNPDEDLVQVRFKQAVDLAEAATALEAAGRVKVHASGWWELTQYIPTAYPKGLSQANPMHKHVFNLLLKHQVREGGHGEKPASMPSLTGGGSPQGDSQHIDKPGGGESPQREALTTAAPGEGQGLPRASAGPTQGLKVKGEGSKAPGDESQAQGVELKDGGGSREGGQGAPDAAHVGLEGVLMRFRALGGYDVPPWARLTLLEALRSQDGPLVDAAAGLYLAHAAGPQGHSVAGFTRALARWLQAARNAKPQGCQHRKENRTWWTRAADDFEHGMKVRWWRCGDCSHVQPEPGSEYLEEHEHAWGPVVNGRAWIQDENGRARLVDSHQACQLCPTRRAAGVEVAS